MRRLHRRQVALCVLLLGGGAAVVSLAQLVATVGALPKGCPPNLQLLGTGDTLQCAAGRLALAATGGTGGYRAATHAPRCAFETQPLGKREYRPGPPRGSWWAAKLSPGQLHHAVTANLLKLNEIGAAAGGVRWIAMHGTLIGWARNRESIPFDPDADVDILPTCAARLRSWLRARKRVSGPVVAGSDDQPCHWHYDVGGGFTMEQWTGRGQHLQYRLVDRASGVFTDVMELLKVKPAELPPEAELQRLERADLLHSRPPQEQVAKEAVVWTLKATMNKLWGGNIYLPRDLLPLKNSTLNGVPIWVPRDVDTVLVREFPHYKRPPQPYGFDEGTRCYFHVPTGSHLVGYQAHAAELPG